MWGSLAFLKEYWGPLLALAPVIAALGFIAYVSRDWRVAAAAVAIVAVMLYADHLFKQGYNKREAELRAEYTRVLAEREVVRAEAEAEYRRQKAEDDARLAELQRVIDETPPNDQPAVPRSSGGRIRSVR